MRWPIQRQLLVPMLLVVLLASSLSSGASAWVGSSWAKREEYDRLARVVATLSDANFPLQEAVLQKLAGLSGAEFIVWDAQLQVHATTLTLNSEVRTRLKAVPHAGSLADLSNNPTIKIQGRSFLTAKVPLRRATTGSLSLLVLYPEDRWWTATRGAILPPLIAGGVTALVAIVLTAWWSRRFTRPIARLSQQSERIAGGEFQPMLLPVRNDELRDLTLSINRMVEQLTRYEQQVRRNERLKTLGQLGAGLAHQLRNWLTGACMALQWHARECPLGKHTESTVMALRQLGLMESYLHRFLTLGARRGETLRLAEQHEVPLAPLVEEVLSLVQTRGRHVGVELHWSPPSSPITVYGDCGELQELLVNLLLNSVDAAAPRESIGGPAWVRVEVQQAAANLVRLRVLDSGPGPSDAVAAQLFEPFVTDKPEGTGLGLAVAKQIAESHGGSLRWFREDGVTCFEVELPRS
jgi:signal transduction histidine kinase